MKRGGAASAVCSLLLLAACAPPVATTNAANESAAPSPSPSSSAGPTPPAALELVSAPFHNGEIGLAYTGVTLGAAGGTAPYTWAVTALPPGLALGADGSVTGTPTKTGTYAFTASVADAAGSTATRRVSVTVYSGMRTTQVCALKCQIGVGCTRCGGFGTVAGGMPPYRYAVVGGSVPQGMAWKALSLSGPFPAGAFNLHVQVTDALGAQTAVVANWVIYRQATLVKGGGTCTNNFRTPVACSVTWNYTGGDPFVDPVFVITKYSADCGANGCSQVPTGPPPGWNVAVKGGVITMSASSSACTTYYDGYMTFVLRDPATCGTTSASAPGTVLFDLRYAC